MSKDVQDSLAVAETKLGGLIKDKLGIQCVHDAAVDELFRGIRSQLNGLIVGARQRRAGGAGGRGRTTDAGARARRCHAATRPAGERDERDGARSVAQPVAVQAQVQPGQGGHDDHSGHWCALASAPLSPLRSIRRG